jgi:hypothetical protein
VGTAKILIPEVALKAVDPEWFPPPSEVGICRHLYLADEEYLIRNENGRVVEAVNLGTEGNAVDEYDFGTETVTVDGHQDLDGSSIYYASLASQLGFGGTELTMFAAVHSRTDYYPGDLGPFAAISLNPNYITSYRPNVVFKCASSYARADVNYQYLGCFQGPRAVVPTMTGTRSFPSSTSYFFPVTTLPKLRVCFVG